MRAARLLGPGEMRLEQVARPKPSKGEVRIRLEGCGVCASNLEPWAGNPWTSYPAHPGELGHEGWGVIDSVGLDAGYLRPGDRVASLGCRSYAEYDIARANCVALLPRELEGRPFPGEPLGCAFNIFRRGDVRAGQVVAIIGIGFLGAVLTRLASRSGARVIAISRRDSSLELARNQGAAEVIRMDDHATIIAEVAELTGGKLCDRVIECVGYQWPLDLAGELVGLGGRLVIAGYHQDGPRQVNMQMWNWKGIDVVNAHERDPAVQMAGLRAAIDAVVTGHIDIEPLCTHVYPLERLDEALNATRDKPPGFVKALVMMT